MGLIGGLMCKGALVVHGYPCCGMLLDTPEDAQACGDFLIPFVRDYEPNADWSAILFGRGGRFGWFLSARERRSDSQPWLSPSITAHYCPEAENWVVRARTPSPGGSFTEPGHTWQGDLGECMASAVGVYLHLGGCPSLIE